MTRQIHNLTSIILALLFVVGLFVSLYRQLDRPLLSHNVYDTYTIQALQWWKGKIALDGDVPHLELAIYRDQYWVSFPPVPAVVEFLLVPFFGKNTPNNLLSTLYTWGSIAAITGLVYRKSKKWNTALFWGAGIPLSSNLLVLSVSGSVWFSAQSLSFLFSSLAILLMSLKKPLWWHLSLLFWALSIGTRPLQILFGPVLLWMLWQNKPKRLLTYLIAPLVIGLILGGYNWWRFDTPLEFGHSYLPFHVQSEHGQFSTTYVSKNLKNIMRLPSLTDGGLDVPLHGGFAFYLANPFFILVLIRLIARFKKLQTVSKISVIAFLLHLLTNLMHISFGEYQFGTRYLVDAIPYLFLVIVYEDLKIRHYDIGLILFGLLFNIYGLHLVHL
jgi:hypothetical protein